MTTLARLNSKYAPFQSGLKDAFDALIDGEEELFFYKILANHFIPNPPHIDDSDIFIGR